MRKGFSAVQKFVMVLVAAGLVLTGFGAAAVAQSAGVNFLPLASVTAQAQSDDDGQAALDLLLTQAEVRTFLDARPGWRADTYQEDDTSTVWHVDLYTVDDEWTGYGVVDLGSGAILEWFVPRELSPEEYQAGQARIEFFIAHDPEFAARLGTPELWYHEVYFEVWEQAWFAYFTYGIDTFVAKFWADENDVYLDDFYDPNVLDALAQEEADRNRAVELAWQADTIDQALAGVDNWRTYVEHQGDARYSVEFVTPDGELFYALVDIATGEVLETQP